MPRPSIPALTVQDDEQDSLRPREYYQAHLPVREQSEAVGHAVRAMYLYSAMADLAGETGDETLRTACRRLWDHLCATRLYVTGGIGSSAENEGFTSDYDLPNRTAYAETCASIGLLFWAHRMIQLEGDGRYADVLESALYNRVLSGVSLDGTRFFYDNPLASQGTVTRREWFGVSCCPPNLARLLASLGQYIYSTSDGAVAVHLYVQSRVQVNMHGQAVTLRQEADYPWDGQVKITVATGSPIDFTLHLRVPGWCRDAALLVNGEALDLAALLRDGYAPIKRTWSNADEVRLVLSMPIERIYAHPAVPSDAGRVALQRGPIVYCLEEADNPVALHKLVLPAGACITARRDGTLLDGVVTLHGEARAADAFGWGNRLYRHEPATYRTIPLTAIPYYAWDNRRRGQMTVWIREQNACEGGD